MKHTPGPWENFYGVIRSRESENVIATVWSKTGHGCSVSKEEAEANTSLIVATPYLLEACQFVCLEVEKQMDFGERPCPFCERHHNHGNGCPYVACKTAVTKARGE